MKTRNPIRSALARTALVLLCAAAGERAYPNTGPTFGGTGTGGRIEVSLTDRLPAFGVAGAERQANGIAVTLARTGSNTGAAEVKLQVASPEGYVESGEYMATVAAGAETGLVVIPFLKTFGPTDEVTITLVGDSAYFLSGERTATLTIDSADVPARNRTVGYALSGFGRSLGWDTVDAVRGRTLAEQAVGQGGGRRSMLEADSVKQYLAAELRAQSSPQAGGLDRESLNATAFGGNVAPNVAMNVAMNATESVALHDSYGAVGHPGARAAAEGGGPQWQNLRVWASAERGAMAFAPGRGLDFDGDTQAFRMGVEGNHGDYLVGVALTYFTGDIGFSDARNGVDGDMKLEQRFLSPYAAVTLGGFRLWGTVGLGAGTLDYRDAHGSLSAVGSSDTDARLLAVGAEFDVARRGEMELVGRLEGMNTQLRTDGTKSEGIDLYNSQEVDVRGTRGELEASWSLDSERVGGLVRPYLSAGFRWDEGDDLNGRALEYGGGLRVQTDDISFDGALHSQMLEGAGDFERGGVSLSLAYDRGSDGKGLRLNVSNRHGGMAGQDPFERSMSYAGHRSPQRMTTSVGADYGVDLGHSTLRPHATMEFIDGSAASRLVTGLSLTNGRGGLGQGFKVDLTHTLDVAPDPSRDDRHALELKANVRF